MVQKQIELGVTERQRKIFTEFSLKCVDNVTDKGIRKVRRRRWNKETDSAISGNRRFYQLLLQNKDGYNYERYKCAWMLRFIASVTWEDGLRSEEMLERCNVKTFDMLLR